MSASPDIEWKNQLRDKAKSLVSDLPASGFSVSTLDELLHELQVHHIELEMQNEELRQARDIIEQSRDKYTELYESSPISYITLGSTGQITGINLTGAAQFGDDRKKLLDCRFSHFICAEDRDRWERHFIHTLKTDGVQVCELKAKRSDASVFDASLNCQRVFENNKVAGVRIALTDTTAQNEATQTLRLSEEAYRSSFNQAAVGIARLALDGKWLEVNQQLCEIVGYSRSEMLQLTFQDITSPDDLGGDLEYLGNLLDGTIKAFKSEKRYIHKSGEAIWVNIAVATEINPDGSPKAFIAVIENIAERKKLENTLAASEKEFRSLAEAMPQIVWITRPDGWNIYFNQQWVDYTGLTFEESYGHGWNKPFHPDDQKRSWDAWQNAVSNNGTYSLECRLRRADGEYRWWLVRGEPALDDAGNIYKWFGTCTDIHEIKQAEQELQVAATAFEAQVGIMVTDSNSQIIKVNQVFSVQSGYSPVEIVGKTPRLLKSGRHDADFYAAMWNSISANGFWQGEIWDRRKDGEIYPKWMTISSIKDKDGNVTQYVCTQNDISERKAAEMAIANLAFYDPLTQLPNRRLLQDRLLQALASSERTGNYGALQFIDLDHFKTINDTLGHPMGDLLLQQVAQRLTACVREGDTVARLGGDEFVVMLEDLSQEVFEAAARAEAIGEKIIATLNQPYLLGNHESRNSPSIGISLFNDHQQKPEELFKQADIAMYQAKKAGRNTLRFFDPEMQHSINAHAALENELRKALEYRQFHLHYQIQVDSNRSPLGAEALIRWIHPERGLIPPSEFIPLAEETGLILPLGKWVLETACAQLYVWKQNDLTRNLKLSVNVSAKQFHEIDFVAQVQTALLLYDINPALLKLELTESMLVGNIEVIVATMEELKATGVRLSLDDFGTGYSSLQYLKRLPLSQLKIDQSFVREIVADSSDRAIVNTIIAMAHNLNLNVIAEGVETEDQRQILEYSGCHQYQGYLFSKPVPIDKFEALLGLV
jgi:diguanylate cyclase (GGDEF)-like protein/PAS domain S-box-containing protein